ncbi:MAG: hypothetical protein ABW000_06895 [Actinoplanes sp.]
MIESEPAPRGRFLRTVLAGLFGLALLLISVGPETFVKETTGSEYLGWLVSGILPCLVGAWLAPKVSYRRRDALIFLTLGPSALPSGPLFLKIIWRTAYLPHRDWPESSDQDPDPGAASSHAQPAQPAEPAAARSRPSWARDVTTA